MKKKVDNIKTYQLDPSFYLVHKEKTGTEDFGLDHTTQLIADGFGLYSSAGLKPFIGPIKSEFYRIGFVVQGSVQVQCGLENFLVAPGWVVFTFPGQLFSLRDKSTDFFAYYMLFKEDFIADAIPLKAFRVECAFLNYGGTPAFNLGPTEAREIQGIILKINEEIKRKGSNLKQIIQLYIHLLLLQAKRSYENTPPHKPKTANNLLLTQYKKLVSQHFSTLRQVSDYAKMLNVTSNHLNKVIKSESGRTAHALIAEMLMLEAKALILHTSLSISEIAWKLDFADPSYFNKFFKKHSGMTPLQLRRP